MSWRYAEAIRRKLSIHVAALTTARLLVLLVKNLSLTMKDSNVKYGKLRSPFGSGDASFGGSRDEVPKKPKKKAIILRKRQAAPDCLARACFDVPTPEEPITSSVNQPVPLPSS